MGIYLEYGASETTKASQRSKAMDNITYDALNRSPRKSNEPYTTYETQSGATLLKRSNKQLQQSTSCSNNGYDGDTSADHYCITSIICGCLQSIKT